MASQEDYDFLFKIVLIGDSGVGKTNLLSRFVDNAFSEDSKPTIGVQFSTKTVQVNTKMIKSQIWDTAGQERFRAITTAYYRDAAAAIVVYDLTRPKTFENVANWIAELRSYAKEDITIMLVANKADMLDNREVDQERALDYANTQKILYMETSALTGSKVEEAFQDLIKETYEKLKDVPPETPIEPVATIESSPKTKDSQKSNRRDDFIGHNKVVLDDKHKNKNKKSGCC